MDTTQARAFFPRGLVQPEGACRFSADGLLLAAFLKPEPKEGPLLDLGCGCGAAAFAALLGRGERETLGVDLDEALLAAAEENARLLGLDRNFATMLADLRNEEERRRIPAGAFGLACANPPYHRAERGRVPPGEGRRGARFDQAGLLESFLRAAHRGLAPRGRFAVVFPAPRLADLLSAMRAAKLEPRRLRCVHGKADAPAQLVLAEARKGGRPDLTLEPPLILHEGQGRETRLTEAAREFCPYLGQ